MTEKLDTFIKIVTAASIVYCTVALYTWHMYLPINKLQAAGVTVVLYVGLYGGAVQYWMWKRTSLYRWERLPIPDHMREHIKRKCDYKCSYCGGWGGVERGPDGEPWNIEHVIPISRGGPPRHPGNLTLSCETCNLEKGPKTAFEYLQRFRRAA